MRTEQKVHQLRAMKAFVIVLCDRSATLSIDQVTNPFSSAYK